MGNNSSNSKRSANDIQTFLEKEKEKFLEKIDNPLRQNANLEDFDLIRTIGTGSFGNFLRFVFLQEENSSFFLFRSSDISHS